MIVICGEHTHTATGVAAELEIAQEEKLPVFSALGIYRQDVHKAYLSKSTDQIYNWTWDNLKALIKGDR